MTMTSTFSSLLALLIVISGAIREASVVISAAARDDGIDYYGLSDPCGSIVAGSEPRNEEPNECKCKDYFQKVWCPGKGKIHERKFRPEETKAACPDGAAYCSKKESTKKEKKQKEVLAAKATLNQGDTNDISQVKNEKEKIEKDMVVGSVDAHHIEQQQVHIHDGLDVSRQPVSATTTASRANDLRQVKNEKDLVVGSVDAHNIEQKQAHVQDGLETNQQTVPATTMAIRTTTAEPTTPIRTTEENPSHVWVVLAPAFWASTEWKCCEHSQGAADPQIVNIKDANNLPKARMGFVCKDRKGCGCMYGDHWHNIDHKKSPGQCKVTLAYAMYATKWRIQEFNEYRQRDQNS